MATGRAGSRYVITQSFVTELSQLSLTLTHLPTEAFQMYLSVSDDPTVNILFVLHFSLKVFFGQNQLMDVWRASWFSDHLKQNGKKKHTQTKNNFICGTKRIQIKHWYK